MKKEILEKNKKIDRRVHRTRSMLQKSLIQLMNEKEIKDITVKELSESADITRGTFYLHYNDIYDILRSMEYELFTEFNEILNKSFDNNGNRLSPEAILSNIFFFLERHRDAAKVLMGPHGDIAFVNRLKDLVKDRIYSVLTQNEAVCQYDYAEAFAVSGCIGVIETWLHHSSPLSPDEMAKICSDMLIRGLDLT